MSDNALTKLDQATRMLAEVKTIDDAKKIVNLAEAARVYAREVELGLEAQNHAAEIKLRAQRRGGEILAKMDADGKRETRGGDRKSKSQDDTLIPPTLDDLGISKADSSRWQQIAQLPADQFEAVIAETMGADKELTTAAMLREAQSVKRDQVYADKTQQQLPDGKYQVFYADPPWQYSNSGFAQSAANQYPTMPTDSICLFPISDMAMDDSVLFLWVTSPLLPDGLRVMGKWGFEYKASMVWVKDRAPGIRFWVDTRHEILLIGARGSFMPRETFDSVHEEAVTRHSKKPEEYYAMIESMFPNAKMIELFSRNARDGWEAWGNE